MGTPGPELTPEATMRNGEKPSEAPGRDSDHPGPDILSRPSYDEAGTLRWAAPWRPDPTPKAVTDSTR